MKAFALQVLALCLATLTLVAQDVLLRAGDQLEIRLGGVPIEEIQQISGNYQVDDQGFVNLAHIGKIKASGLNQGQLQTAIESAYKTKQIYTNPTIIVGVSPQARFVNVGGAVRNPRRVEFTTDLTVLGAINAAGGLTEFANPSKVSLLRNGSASIVDLKEVRRDPSRDVKLSPGDSIEVPQSFW